MKRLIVTASLPAACAAFATLVLHSCCLASAYAALAPIRWEADVSKSLPFSATIAQGETRDLICTIKNYGVAVAIPSGYAATMHYQTNGMGRLYWPGGAASVTTNGVISAAWTPSLDCGADAYRFTLGVTSGSNTLYAAHGVIRMRKSPGWVPNELPQPWRTLDFATIDVSNAPWATPADVASATDGLLSEEEDPLAGAWQTNHLATSNPHGVTAAQAGALDLGGGTVTGQVVFDSDAGGTATLLDENGISFVTPDGNSTQLSAGYGAVAGPNNRWAWPTPPTDGERLLTESDINATSNWVESIRGVHVDIATNVVYHIVVSNGHWLIRESN